MGESETFLCPRGSFGWSNQIGMRQVNQRKSPNLTYTFVWEPCIHERIRDATCTGGSETEGETEVHGTV